MATQLIQTLPCLCRRVSMKPPLRALLHQLQAPRGAQSEDATLLTAVPGCHHYGDSLIKHGLHQTQPVHTMLMHDQTCPLLQLHLYAVGGITA